MRLKERRVIYYRDELNDEFSEAKITPRVIDKDYKYIHNSHIKRFTHFFWYRMVATPIAWLYAKLFHRYKIIGKEKVRGHKKCGYFLYGNHTHHLYDTLIPSLIAMPKDCYVIVHPNNVSMPYLGRVTPSMGAIPLPSDRTAYKNFREAIDYRIKEGCAVAIYPEAHIWPYYTKIRPFPDTSFTYPASLMCPIFVYTNTYKKRRLSGKPRIVTYVDGPYFPDPALSLPENRKRLRRLAYEAMCERCKNSDIEYIKYIKGDDNNG